MHHQKWCCLGELFDTATVWPQTFWQPICVACSCTEHADTYRASRSPTGLQHETLLAARLCLLIGFLWLFGLLVQAYSSNMLLLADIVIVATVCYPWLLIGSCASACWKLWDRAVLLCVISYIIKIIMCSWVVPILSFCCMSSGSNILADCLGNGSDITNQRH